MGPCSVAVRSCFSTFHAPFSHQHWWTLSGSPSLFQLPISPETYISAAAWFFHKMPCSCSFPFHSGWMMVASLLPFAGTFWGSGYTLFGACHQQLPNYLAFLALFLSFEAYTAAAFPCLDFFTLMTISTGYSPRTTISDCRPIGNHGS